MASRDCGRGRAREAGVSKTDSYKDKTFLVVDPDARIRKTDDIMHYETYTAADPPPPGEQIGGFMRIPKGESVRVDEIKVVPTGAKASIIFARVLSSDGTKVLGWTSTRNFRGRFVNETLGAVEPAPGAGQYGPNAAWQSGKYLGQVTLVDIVDASLDIERIALNTLDAYLDLVRSAAETGVEVAINSGFRSYPEQKVLYEGYKKGLKGFNKAAPPGRSNHQNGIAFDIPVAGGSGNPTYGWLKRNGPARGFVRTVNGEPWHWEFDQAKAVAAVAARTYKTGNVTV
jgi:hypothetical protein